MNLTLGTLAELKAHLLNEGVRAQTDFDATIAALGRGVAAQFERHCNRRFARAEDDTFECQADRAHVVLPRLPVENISKLELGTGYEPSWSEITRSSNIEVVDKAAGIVEFVRQIGTRRERLRLTYTGGYWFDESADGTLASSRTWQQGSVSLAQDAETAAVVFSPAFDQAPHVMLVVEIPADGVIISAVPASVTASGFTARLAFPVPATGYTLRWTASLASVAETPSSEQPEGSTLRPHDLYLAWLLQCEHVWALRDKLGLNTQVDRAGVSPELLGLSRVDLIPAVKETLQRYIRYSLA